MLRRVRCRFACGIQKYVTSIILWEAPTHCSFQIYKGDGYHLMPIITPAYPSMCATFNITHSSKAVIQKELDFFAEQVEQIMLGKLPWKSLFVKHTFFTQDYKYYIIVNAASMTKENSKIWGGFVESKIRLLVQSLERHASIQLARPFNKGYERKHKCSHNHDEWPKILDGSLEYMVKDEDCADEGKTESATGIVKAEPQKEDGIDGTDVKNTDEKMETEDDKADKHVFTSTHYIGIELRPGEFISSNNYLHFCTHLLSWSFYPLA